ncbi:MAG: signal recognition particle-docking protein FtsY [Chromatiales bacterium]|jgi:fused signal recognition particle receptor|nr:MAG: signal recognition particle-docking protein FtsY [Chromatiales bacterium]
MPTETNAGTRSRPGFFARLKERLLGSDVEPDAVPALEPGLPAPTMSPSPPPARSRLGSALDWMVGRELDDQTAEELENHLLSADVNLATATDIIRRVKKKAGGRNVTTIADARHVLAEALAEILAPLARPLVIPSDSPRPFVILMVGVNGAGKTTTIGKLARRFKDDGLRVMLAAGDTYRAAAIEQLQIWGQRNDVPVIAQQTGADPAAVVYDAIEAARARGCDVLLADTAGRLQNKAHLMQELQKVVRVIRRLDPTAPHETMIVLDASLGQNAVTQAKQFHEAIGITGITMTKLDAGGKGGVLLTLASELPVPVRFIGIGEQAADMDVFDAGEFAAALTGTTPPAQ